MLVVTILTQIYRQWQQGSSKGVSKWLFIGQMAASAGFLLYSWLIHDMVFLFTNAVMVMSAAAGLGIVFGIAPTMWMRNVPTDLCIISQNSSNVCPSSNQGYLGL